MEDANDRESLKCMLSMFLRYGGIAVKEYSEDRCVVEFDVSEGGVSVALYAVVIVARELEAWTLFAHHLPLGFCLDAVAERHPIMTKDYFLLLHRSLTAHHDRLNQIKKLKEALCPSLQVIHSLNATLIELVMNLQDGVSIARMAITLKYDQWDFTPNSINVSRFGILQSKDVSVLEAQIAPFYERPLLEAFSQAFMNRENHFICVL